MAKKNILITGGSGFIGQNLIENLNQKFNVLAPGEGELNILKEDKVERFILKNKIDIIVHGAGVGGGRDSTELENVIYSNLRMFFNIARCQTRVEKIIHFGSGAEYGKSRPLKKVKEEFFDKYIPTDDYGFYKYVCSKYIEKSKNIVCLRLFGVYGKYENYLYRFISNTIVRKIFNLPIIIGQNVYFDYLYIDDLTKIVEFFLLNAVKHKAYNVATGRKVDLITLANIIERVSKKPSKIMIKNKGLNNEYTADNSRLIKEMTNFSFTPHEVAVILLYRWYEENLSKIDSEKVIEDPYFKNIKVKK